VGQLTQPDLWQEAERRRLVRLCAAVSGDRDAAEDLAQETLLEAWRNAHKLRDPAGADRWLAAIARNVCRRWARRRGREAEVLGTPDVEGSPAEGLDVEAALERAELVELLDQALGRLPRETRDVLIDRYVHERSHGEIGARLGISEDAASMRLARGKAVLRRVLESELRSEASAYGLVRASGGEWRETRVWCACCGRRKLLLARDSQAGAVSFRCGGCDRDPGALSAEFRLDNPFFAGLVGHLVRPSAILARASAWSRRYFAGGVGAEVGCTRCGRPGRLGRGVRRTESGWVDRHVLYAACDACGEQVSASLEGFAAALPEVGSFRRDRPRARALPRREVSFAGVPAIVVRYEDLFGSSGVDVVFARETLRVLDARGPTS
jgi:RNA polymerase sigma-70 factor (ECF subfamily)